jgi:hypothetical protein
VTADLLRLRVIGAPQPAAQAAQRLAELLTLDRQHGPHPARKHPGQVRYYLAGRLRPPAAGSAATTTSDPAQPAAPVDTVEVCWSGAHGQWRDQVDAGATVRIPNALYARYEAAPEQLDDAEDAVDAWLTANHAEPRTPAAPRTWPWRTAE